MNVIESREIYNGRVISLRVDRIQNYNKVSIREVVKHRGSVGILPILDDLFVMERQYRYAIDKNLLEIPAGTLEIGEEPIECARRELIEETGYKAGKLEYLGRYYLTPGYCTEMMHFFLATDLSPVEERELDDDEEISVIMVKIEDAIKMAMRGEIEDLKTTFAITKFAYTMHKG